MLFQKAATNELISAASSLALLGKNLFSVVGENWFLVSENSGNLYSFVKWQPCKW